MNNKEELIKILSQNDEIKKKIEGIKKAYLYLNSFMRDADEDLFYFIKINEGYLSLASMRKNGKTELKTMISFEIGLNSSKDLIIYFDFSKSLLQQDEEVLNELINFLENNI